MAIVLTDARAASSTSASGDKVKQMMNLAFVSRSYWGGDLAGATYEKQRYVYFLHGVFDPTAGATRNRFFFRADNRRTTHRATHRHHEFARIVRSTFGHDSHHFRYHLARATDDHVVANAHILAPDFIFIV